MTAGDRIRVALRLGVGLADLLATPAVARTCGVDASHQGPAVAVIRVLGARHLAQAALEALVPDRRVRLAGIGVDLAHAASMVALAAWSPAGRRPALTSATVATSLAGLSAVGLAAGR